MWEGVQRADEGYMYHFFAESSQLIDDGKRIIIDGSDYNHMVNVLRMKVGE